MAPAFRLTARPSVSENMSQFTVDFSTQRAVLQRLHFLPAGEAVGNGDICDSGPIDCYELEYRKTNQDGPLRAAGEACWEKIYNIRETHFTLSAYNFGFDAATAHAELKVQDDLVTWEPQGVKGQDHRLRGKENKNRNICPDQLKSFFHAQKSSKAAAILQKVFSHLHMVEVEFFGLRFCDNKQQTNWLDPSKTLCQHRDLLEEGNDAQFDSEENKEKRLYKTLSAVSRPQAQNLFLSLCSSLPMFGVSLFAAYGENQTEYFLGPTPVGVVIYKNKVLVGKYIWQRITKLHFKDETFELRVIGKNPEQKSGWRSTNQTSEKEEDWNLTWYTSRPDLTQCFQQTVLVWFPCVYLWTCSPLYLLYLQLRPHRGVIPLSKLCCSKTLLGLSLALLSLLEIFYFLVKKNEEIQNHLLILIGPLIRSLTLGFSSDGTRFTAFFICFSLQLIELILSCFSDHRPLSEKHTYIQNQCPEDDASFLSKFFFFWFSSLVVQGYRCPLQSADLWPLRDQDSSNKIMIDLEKFWTQNCKQLQYNTLP
ncbi:Multidrug resistance-associated protein 1 [Nibea albiflora]|uniref:Multidrug resistance-associated protein 1 n=1 Tax=Nibea albiflora TaxID=240163 RepID=A0ACB7F879_NIBAL|nr:Multidrug resistance-associated protein 1 [Nibea albiflora]